MTRNGSRNGSTVYRWKETGLTVTEDTKTSYATKKTYALYCTVSIKTEFFDRYGEPDGEAEYNKRLQGKAIRRYTSKYGLSKYKK